MTILVLTPTYAGRDGLSCLSRDIIDTLPDALPGATVRAWSLAGPAVLPASRAVVRGCDGSRADLAARVAAATAQRPSLVLVLHAHLLPLAWPALALGIPLVHVLVGVEVWRPLRVLEVRALARATALIAISRHTRDRFREAHPGVAGLPIHVCHPSIPVLPPPASSSVLPPPGYALMVGRMAADERYKGHDVVLDAWPRVVSAVAGARLIIAGDGDDTTRLRQRVAGERLTGSVAFTGRVDDATLSALYAGAACFVMPSVDEGFGYVFLEAMAAGLPCVAAAGAAEEIVDDGVSGTIVRPRDARHVADAVIGLLTQPDRARAMGLAGRARAGAHFSRSRFAADLRAALSVVTPC